MYLSFQNFCDKQKNDVYLFPSDNGTEAKEEGEEGQKELTKNFPNLMKNIYLHIKKAQQTPDI